MSQLKIGRPSKNKKDKAIAAMKKLENDTDTIRMNINISKRFYKQIKQKALDEDKSITEIVKMALSNYMSK